MPRTHHLSLLLATVSLVAQTPTAPTAILPTVMPLHARSTAADDATLWTAAANYKAAFSDRFTFHPYVPEQTTTLAWTWQTESLRTGDGKRQLAAGQRRHGDWQCIFDYDGLSERYDVREDGVEQSFVVHTAPRHAGPIAVRARLSTPCVAAVQAPRVGALTFRTPSGVAALTYGIASVRDAAGREAPVTTAFDGTHIELQVAAEFVAAAAFPITIDPLTAPVAVNSGTLVTDTAIAATSTVGNHATLVAIVRQFSATDRDVYAYTIADDGSAGPTTVFTDQSTIDMPRMAAAEVGPLQTWLLAIETATPTVVIYRQGQANPLINSWTTVGAPLAGRNAALGGTSALGNRALLVYEGLVAGQWNARGAYIDPAANTAGPGFSLSGSLTQGAARSPAVSHSAGGLEPWRVAWSEDSGNGTDFLIRTNLVDATAGAFSLPRTHTVAANAREPRIDGGSNRFLLAWIDAASGNDQLRARRFDYSLGGAISNLHDHVLATALSLPVQTLTQGDVAYDPITQSHWAVTWRSTQFLLSLSTSVHIVRLGYTGGTVEATPLHATGTDGVAWPVVAWDGYPQTGQAEGFVAAYAANNLGGAVNFRRLSYTPPSVSIYGTSCRNNTMGDGHPPYAGSEFYRMAILGLPAGAPALWVFGTQAANAPLDGLGMIGCSLLVNPITQLVTVADGTGQANLLLALPDDPAYFGDYYYQWAWFEPGANPFGFVTGRGAHVQVQ